MSDHLKKFEQAIKDSYEKRQGDTAPELKLWLGQDLIDVIKTALAPAPLQLAMDDELKFILGQVNFSCRHYAQMLRAMGQEIPPKAELEQAAVILWGLNLYLKHGAGWREEAGKIIQDHLSNVKEKEPAAGASAA